MKLFSHFILISFLAGLAACQDTSMLDLKNFVETAHSEKKPSIEPLPVPKPHLSYIYSSSDSIDPFNVKNIQSSEKQLSVDPRNPNRRKEELESFPLDGIRVVGTMAVGNSAWAVVNAPDGTIHKVKSGRYMGENDGRVVKVDLDEQKVTLIEDVKSATGEWVQREVFLSVSDE